MGLSTSGSCDYRGRQLSLVPRILIFTTQSMPGLVGIQAFIEKHASQIAGVVILPNVPKNTSSKTTRLPIKLILYKIAECYLFSWARWLIGKPSVSSLLKKHGIAYKRFSDPNDPSCMQWIQDLQPTVIFNLAPAKIGNAILNLPKQGCYNFHGAPLPNFKGVANYFWYHILGCTEAGATVHLMTEKFDEGAIAGHCTISIQPTDSVHSINYRVSQLAPALFSQITTHLQNDDLQLEHQKEPGTYRSFPTRKDIHQLSANRKSIIPLSHFWHSLQH